MESIYLLIPLVMVFTAVVVWVFVWAVNNGQYDDLDKEAEPLIFDNENGISATVQEERKKSD